MDNNIIQNPHDRFIRHMMSKPKVIEEFFCHNLPADIKSAIDLNTIQLEPESLIDDKLRLQITDLLYSVQFNQKQGYIYLLVEHLSASQRLAPFRILKYSIDIMQKHLDKTGDKILPIIYPMIIFASKREYHHSVDLFDLFAHNKELAKSILYQPCKLIDLTQTPDEELIKHVWFGTMARTMKYIFSEDIISHIRTMKNEIQVIEKNGELNYIQAIFSYVLTATGAPNPKEFKQILTEVISDQSRGEIMTLAEKFVEQGLIESARKIALKMLNLGIDKTIITQATNFSLEELNELEKSRDAN